MSTPAVGFRNGDLICRNISFDYTLDPPAAQPGVITANGQLLIGSVVTTPNIAMSAGTLTSPDASVVIGYAYPNITLQAVGGGGGTLNTLTPDVGGAVIPIANNINVNGLPSLGFGLPQLQSMTSKNGNPNLQIKAPNCALFIVDANALYGTHTTIQSAITDASTLFVNTGIVQTVFVRPGIYTENITMATGVNLQGFCSEYGASSTLLGSMTVGSVGTIEVNSMLIQTNGSVSIVGTSGAGSKVVFNNCGLLATNANMINLTVNHIFRFTYCWGQLTSMGICYVTVAVGLVSFHWCRLNNSAASVTYNTMNSGELDLSYTFLQMPIAVNGASNYAFAYSSFGGGGPINVPGLVHNGGVGTYFVTNCTIGGGGVNNPAMIVNGLGGIIFNGNNVLGNNSGTVMASGTGTISYNAFNFTGPGNLITITNQSTQAMGPRIALTQGPQILSGAGVPAITAPKGSLFLRNDAVAVNTRAYINTNGGAGWTAILTAG